MVRAEPAAGKHGGKNCLELRKQEKLTSCVTVKIRYSNFDTHTLQKRIPYTSFDHVLSDVAKELFGKLYQRRMLIRLIGSGSAIWSEEFSSLICSMTPPKGKPLYDHGQYQETFRPRCSTPAVGVMTVREKRGKSA